MMVLWKWTLVFGVFALSMHVSHAYTFANKGQVNGPAIHTTYFFTTNNIDAKVKAKAYVGHWTNGACLYAGQYDMGVELLRTGNQVYLDASKLKSIIGNGYTCMTISYFNQQPVLDTFQLLWNGSAYTATLPATSNVTAL
jgi:hypothetical protein